MNPETSSNPVVVHEGRFLNTMLKGTWEYVERRNISGIVAILAVTPEDNILLVEQFRPALGKNVVELPAGLAGDIENSENEALAQAAHRELLEETGYVAGKMEYLTEGPTSAGMSTEIITFFRASDLTATGKGGGDESESIIVHQIPLADLTPWLEAKRQEGCLVDYKIFTGLYFHHSRPA